MKPHRRIVNQPVVLMVEDEPLVRLTQVDILREAEIWVVEAQDADEAFELLKTRPDIRAVLTDVNMPGSMDGFALARWVRANKPGMEVILTSGIERSADIAATLCEAGPLMKKPYSSQDVVDRLRQLAAKARRS